MTPLPDDALVVRGGTSHPRVYADFQNLDDLNRLRLTCAGTQEDLARQNIELREGLVLTFYTDDADDAGQPDDLLADGVVRRNAEEQCWVAEIDWNALRHASQEQRNVNGVPPPKTASNQANA